MELRVLNACPACQRQYDVSHLKAGQPLRCECGESFAAEFRSAHSPKPLKCGGCGANLESGAERCGNCRAQPALEDRGVSAVCPACWARVPSHATFCLECGLKIRPQALIALPEPSACPRCKGALRQRDLGGSSLIECASCAGLWITNPTLARLCELAGTIAPSLDEQPPWEEAKVTYLPCPACRTLMLRKSFAIGSRVVLDRCAPHGVWLDRGELERVLAFVKSGGLVRARRRELDELEEREDALRRRISAHQKSLGRIEGPETPLQNLLIWLGMQLTL